jgi:queuine tRNA-ribosyltransferase
MPKTSFSLVVEKNDPLCHARACTLETPHGQVQTPIFMPVGTHATVKGISPAELLECGCSFLLANAYHLHLRPGDDIIRNAGGIHRFEKWAGPILTDSGGFQVFSLRHISKITDDGVWFQSHIDGAKRFFSPESVIQIERNIGADVIMAFDECPPAKAERAVIERAVERTLKWAERCRESHINTPFVHDYPQALFAIVQGGTHEDLRRQCAEKLIAMDFEGYAIGGCAVGETAEEMYAAVDVAAPMLPVNKPRYLMGVGTPENILECIERGIDMFDCVLPTRNGRNGGVFTSRGRLNMRNACHSSDFNNPMDPDCSCYACRTFSRAYIGHLYRASEMLALRLISLHNIMFFMDLVRHAREHIFAGDFLAWKRETLAMLSREESDGSSDSGLLPGSE